MPIVPNDIFLLISKAFFSKIDNNFTIFLPLPLINSDLREKEETYLIERERERERILLLAGGRKKVLGPPFILISMIRTSGVE